MNIECAFGELTQRWGILWRKLQVGFTRRAPLVVCTMRLHNFIVAQRLMSEMPGAVDWVVPDRSPDMEGYRMRSIRGRRVCINVEALTRRVKFDRDGRIVADLITEAPEFNGIAENNAAVASGSTAVGNTALERSRAAAAAANARRVQVIQDIADAGIRRTGARRD